MKILFIDKILLRNIFGIYLQINLLYFQIFFNVILKFIKSTNIEIEYIFFIT